MTEISLSGSISKPRTIHIPRTQVSYGKWGLRLAAIIYLGVFVAIPVGIVLFKGLEDGTQIFYDSITNRIAWAALKLTLRTAAIMTVINTIMGTLTAYVLVKYRFPGKGIFNAFIDLPFAIPTLVAGVMLVLLYGPQSQIGGYIEQETGYRILFAQPGIILALLFVGYPFVVRTVQPVLLQLSVTNEEAAHSLGASEWSTFWRVVFPTIRPAILTGALLSFARALGEFGSIIIVAGNIPMRSQTATVYIYSKVENDNMQAAAGLSAVLIFIAFAITIAVDIFKWRRHHA